MDLAVAENAADPATQPHAIEFFKREYVTYFYEAKLKPRIFGACRFELDFVLAALKRPYIAVMDGVTSKSLAF